jgi:hypothetical protein
VLRPELGCWQRREGGVEGDGPKQTVPAPLLGIRCYDTIGSDNRQAQPSGGGQDLVPLAPRAELGVEVIGTTQLEDLVQDCNVAGQQDKTFAVVRQAINNFIMQLRAGLAGPVNAGGRSAEGRPAMLIQRQRNYIVSIGNQVSAQNRTDADSRAGPLKLNGTIDAVGVGTGEGSISSPGCRLGQGIGAGDPNPEGEVRVDVKVGEHIRKRERD